MKLTLDQIRSVARGAVRIEESNGSSQFYRFSEEQERLYKLHNEDLYKKTFATAGIRLDFVTNSTRLGLSGSVSSASSRKFFHLASV